MTQDMRATERGGVALREEWITKFVNVVVRELRPGLERMTAVTAARAAWPASGQGHPRQAARDWVAGQPAP